MAGVGRWLWASMICGICMWTAVWLLSGMQLHRGAAPGAAGPPPTPNQVLAPAVVQPAGATANIQQPAGARAPNSEAMPAAPDAEASSQRAAQVAQGIEEGIEGGIPRLASDSAAAKSAGDNKALDDLLALARERHGPYLRSFEAFVSEGRVEELMHNPYPPSDAAHEEHRRPLRSKNLRDDNVAVVKKGSGTWDWVTNAFGGQGSRDSEAKRPTSQKVQEPVSGLKCDFEDDLDYLGKDVGTVEGLTDQACCELCARKKDSCSVAVMSASHDDPPRACWLKTLVTKVVKKSGVRACWPPDRKQALEDKIFRPIEE